MLALAPLALAVAVAVAVAVALANTFSPRLSLEYFETTRKKIDPLLSPACSLLCVVVVVQCSILKN